jgi:hypothetical protein
MPERLSYESTLSREAVAFVVLLSKKQQRVVLDLADQIARQPFQIGDYPTVDAVGRRIENLLLEGYLFSFWVDHSALEVRISEIVKV